MLTLTLRPTRLRAPAASLDEAAVTLAEQFSDLTDATLIHASTPVADGDQEAARHLRWQTHHTRDRLVLETTWHHQYGLVMVDGRRGTLTARQFTALYLLSEQAARAGFGWIGAWQAGGTEEEWLEDLGFADAPTWLEAERTIPALAQTRLPGDLVLEWVSPSPRIMSRLIYFAEDCKIDFEGWIVEDLMKPDTPVTYLELRQGRNTIALARVLVESYLPGMEGYDPRAKTPPVTYVIESFEVHPAHQGHGYGAHLVRAVQALQRPVITLDTYRRAERFWERMGFRHNARRSAREDSNIFEWFPKLGRAQRVTFGDDPPTT